MRSECALREADFCKIWWRILTGTLVEVGRGEKDTGGYGADP